MAAAVGEKAGINHEYRSQSIKNEDVHAFFELPPPVTNHGWHGDENAASVFY